MFTFVFGDHNDGPFHRLVTLQRYLQIRHETSFDIKREVREMLRFFSKCFDLFSFYIHGF
jgi:hypothetical protein